MNRARRALRAWGAEADAAGAVPRGIGVASR